MFTSNTGSVDRIVRIVVGILMIVAGFFFISGSLGTIVGIVGFLPLITGAMGWCPAYIPCKINTRG